MAIRLLIADDHALVREGLRQAFANTPIQIVAEATTSKAAVRLALEMEIDVALLDIQMRDGDRFDSLGQILSRNPKLPVLIYSAHDRADYIQRCADLGARGYLIKGVDKQTLVAAVCDAFAGKTVF